MDQKGNRQRERVPALESTGVRETSMTALASYFTPTLKQSTSTANAARKLQKDPPRALLHDMFPAACRALWFPLLAPLYRPGN